MHNNESNSPFENQNQVSLLRIIDAAGNRTLEGIRVVEDVVRFGFNDRHLNERLKQLRHDIATVLAQPAFTGRLQSRDTLGDVGTEVSTHQEVARADLAHIVLANFARAQEGLRTLSECAKAIDGSAASAFEKARYELYTLEKAVAATNANGERLGQARLYVLIDGSENTDAFVEQAKMLIEEQVDVIQLRDKRLEDRALLERAALLCQLTSETTSSDHRTLGIINDRPDIAAAANADGVHVGQSELPTSAVRSIIGPDALIGVSTHNIAQARQAVLEGADYLGVGPTFASTTKSFDTFPGLDFVSQVADEISLPAFAIGGIDASNANQVAEHGIQRVAVSAAVTKSNNPREAIRAIRAALKNGETLQR